MGLKKTSHTQRRPTRAAGCYGCWLLAPRRAAGRGAHGRLRQGNGAGTGAARSGRLDRLRCERMGRRPGPDRQRAERVRRWRRWPHSAPTGGRLIDAPRGLRIASGATVFANGQRHATFCRPDTHHSRGSFGWDHASYTMNRGWSSSKADSMKRWTGPSIMSLWVINAFWQCVGTAISLRHFRYQKVRTVSRSGSAL